MNVAGATTVILVLVAAAAIFAVAWAWKSTLFGDPPPASTRRGGPAGRAQEHFENSASAGTRAGAAGTRASADASEQVRVAFKTALGRAPTDAEMEFYASEIQGARLTKDDVATLVRISNTMAPPSLGQRYPDRSAYGAVINAFATALFRLPDEAEMEAYYASVASGAMTKDTLLAALEGSQEGQRVRARGFMQATSTRRQLVGEAESAPGRKRAKSADDGGEDEEDAGEEDAGEDAGEDEGEEEEEEEQEQKQKQKQKEPGGVETFADAADQGARDAIRDIYSSIFRSPPDDATVAYIASRFGGGGDVDRKRLASFIVNLERANSASSGDGASSAYQDDLYAELEKSQGADRFSKNNLLLSRSFHWTVPQPRPPVCLPATGNCAVCPQLSQTALLGTLLNDAEATKVGSILPKFVYKEMVSSGLPAQ